MRGSRSPSRCADALAGSIPAGAGEPFAASFSAFRRGVYPRGCGGALVDFRDDPCRAGLSPRVRGSRSGVIHVSACIRSIPAGAGEPRDCVSGHRSCRVYPRGCGGARRRLDEGGLQQGLSPRVRGSPIASAIGRIISGSIPAGAGEPRPRLRSHYHDRVYPRGCGGAIESALINFRCEGLSPRVRGSLVKNSHYSPLLRSIPAGAGEPEASEKLGLELGVYPRGCGGAIGVAVTP